MDELQIACRTQEIAELVAKTSNEAIIAVGEHFNFKCPLAADAKIGLNWAECH